MHTDTASSPLDRAARLATEVLAPWVWVLGLPLAIAWSATHDTGQTLLWGLVTGVFGSVVPMVVIVRGARRGAWSSHHVTNREGRVVPFAACIGSLALGWLILVLGDAPQRMLSLTAAMFATLVVSVVLTFAFRLKTSMHAGVAAGSLVIVAVAYTWWTAPALALLVAAVCWSRLRLKDHSLVEVWTGVVVGLLAGGAGFAVLEFAMRR